MGNLGFLELAIILMAGVAVIGAYVLAIRKIVTSKMTSGQKIGWAFVIIFFHLLGLVAFLIYHDIYLAPVLRGQL